MIIMKNNVKQHEISVGLSRPTGTYKNPRAYARGFFLYEFRLLGKPSRTATQGGEFAFPPLGNPHGAKLLG